MCFRCKEQIIGAKIIAIHLDEKHLVLETDHGLVGWHIDDEWGSSSYFHDFYGVKQLLANGPVIDFEDVELTPNDPGYRPSTWENGIGDTGVDDDDDAHVEVYGYRFITMHPVFGPVSSVLSFRSESEGYYGGEMVMTVGPVITESMMLLEDDMILDH